MKASVILVLIVLVCSAVVLAGCTSSQTASSTGSSGSSASPSSSSSALTTGPTDVMPSAIAVTVSVGQKNDQGKILVTFNGGAGQVNVNGATVTLTRADGSTETKSLGFDAGDQVTMDGTARTPGTLTGAADRVQVSISMNNGQKYNIMDVLRT